MGEWLLPFVPGQGLLGPVMQQVSVLYGYLGISAPGQLSPQDARVEAAWLPRGSLYSPRFLEILAFQWPGSSKAVNGKEMAGAPVSPRAPTWPEPVGTLGPTEE